MAERGSNRCPRTPVPRTTGGSTSWPRSSPRGSGAESGPACRSTSTAAPSLADEIRELFPALVEVEQADEVQQERPDVAEAAVVLPPRGQVGDYRVLREVGRGGMGVVYEAEQVSLGRRVALKVLPRQVCQDLKTLARFRREARSAAQLHHTNIVPVFEVGRDGEVSYYAMQFIQGQGLDLVIGELRRLKDRAYRPVRPGNSSRRMCRSHPGRRRPAPSRARQVSRMAQSLLTGRFGPETPGGREKPRSPAQTGRPQPPGPIASIQMRPRPLR